jgi:hypothetical protein
MNDFGSVVEGISQSIALFFDMSFFDIHPLMRRIAKGVIGLTACIDLPSGAADHANIRIRP